MAITTTKARLGLTRLGAFRLAGPLTPSAGTGSVYGATFTIEVAFGAAPLSRPVTWTDVTDHVRGFHLQRGRTHELDRTQAGELQLRLANKDRKFDPANTASVYYPNVRPMAQVRVTGTFGGTDYPVFWGFVEDWGQTWPGRPIGQGGDAEVVVKAVDGFKLLGLYELVPYSEVVLSDNPSIYLRMHESSLPLTDEGAVGSALTKIGASLYPGGGTAPLSGGAPSMKMDGSAYLEDAAPSTDLILTDNVTLEAWINIIGTFSSVGSFTLVSHGDTTGKTDWRLGYSGVPSLGIPSGLAFGSASTSTTYAGDGYVVAPFGTGPTDFGRWHHVVGVRSGRDLLLYIDGVLASTARFQATILPPTGTVKLDIGATNTGTQPYPGSVAHVAVYPVALSADRVAAHYAAKFDQFAEQPSGSHVSAILDAVGWPTGAARDIDPGASTIAAVTPTGPALDWLMAVAEDSERGLLGFDNDGVIRFHDRHLLLLDHLVSEGTFGDDAADAMSYSDLQVRNDDADLWTTVQVTRQGGATSVASDATAATTYGPRVLDLSGSLVSSDADTLGEAQYLLARYKAPFPRVETLVLIPANDAARNAAGLGLDCHHDRITVKRRPPGGGPVQSVDTHIEGIEMDYTAQADFTVTYHLIPADGTNPWVLDDTTYSVLDSTTALGY